jgi:hypothetical protein
MEIRASGHVVPCRLNNDDAHESIHKKSLHEIWYGEYFTGLRKSMLNKQLPDYCSACASGMFMETSAMRKQLRELELHNSSANTNELRK